MSSGISIVLAISAMLFAMSNELINMQMITNPKALKVNNKSQKQSIEDFIKSACMTSIIFFAMIDVYTSIHNMTLIQQNTLIGMGIEMPLIVVTFYNVYFVSSGLIAQGMTYLTNFVHYIYGSSANSEKKHKERSEKKNPTQIKIWLGEYNKNPILMTSGVSIGAFLYAYGDFKVLLGLMLILTQIQMIQISTANIMIASFLFAACTFFERVLLWGHNFRRFENENKESFMAKRYFFHNIPGNALVRKALTTLRIGLLGIRGVMNAFVYFTGWKKYLGFLSTMSYITASFVQNSLQVNHLNADELTNKKSKKNKKSSTLNHERDWVSWTLQKINSRLDMNGVSY